ncbi:MAG: OmpA family protein [Moraxellaceae bacterium]|nr:OmpA family protein [Pseudomonadales bacterium]MCP5177646.1 OmpA family protein [Moraxellaceae bacterium]
MWAYNITRRACLALAIVSAQASYAEEMVAETLATPQQERISDTVINRDLNTFKVAQERIAKLNNNGTEAENYYLVKAQAWLDFAMHEYYENDRSPVIENALAQAYMLIKQMEAADSQISMDTTVIPESVRLREDLWKIAAQLKQHQGFACAAAPIAEMEVRLVWAGHEHQELGWRHAREHFAAAERLAKKAQKLADNCFCPPEEKPCPMLVAEETPKVEQPKDKAIPLDNKPLLRLVNVPRNIHFALDKSNINTKATLVLDKVVKILEAYPHMNIRLVGHTDSRASKAYNLALSERRAKSVLKYLAQKGIDSSRMGIRGEGFNDLKTAEDELIAHALSRRVEIEYFGEEIESYDQTGDLVVEEMRQQKAAKSPKKASKSKPKVKK